MATQDNRRFAVTAPNGEKNLLLMREMTVHESVSGMFVIKLSCLSETSDIKFADMIGGVVSLSMTLPQGSDSGDRYFHGVVSRFSQGPPVGRFVSYHAEVVPWLWFLTRGSDCRIFQNKSVPEIIKQVFDDLGMSDYKDSLKGKYEAREYVVQYRESHFDFVSRLMEEAGIGYYHEHDEKNHTLVLFDDPASHPYVIQDKHANCAMLIDGDGPPGEILDWVVEQVLPSGKYAATDFNMRDPGTSLLADTKSHIDIGGNDRFELYDYPGEYESLDAGKSLVKLRMEAEEAASYAISGHSSRGDFMAGAKFDLKGHYRADFDKTYVITSVVHQATQGYGANDAELSYSNTFTCIPFDVPFRPLQRTARPRISGAQTATVVGAKGEEIDVDEYGRVIVKFHWDRAEQRDETSSCRVRVSQAWAGKMWGAVFHPRIGQEVIVEFLEGDPDRPIITGRVYNGEQKIPFDLPAEKTQSGIQSRSTKSGGNDNFNQIRFEDKKGSELLAIQAEKDLSRLVKHDHDDEIGNDSKETVGHDRTTGVGNDSTLTIGHNQKETVDNDKTITVDGRHTETIGKAESLTVKADRTRKVGGLETVTIEKDQEIAIKGARKITVQKDLTHDVKRTATYKAGGQVVIDGGDEVVIQSGKARIQLKQNGDIVISGNKIQIDATGDIVMKGQTIKQN